MRTWFKSGVLGELTPIAQKGFGRVVRLYYSKGLEFFCTSIREGTHSPGSLHYLGMAFDFQAQEMPLSEIRRVLGKDWDVVPSNNGAIHAEYDPK